MSSSPVRPPGRVRGSVACALLALGGAACFGPVEHPALPGGRAATTEGVHFVNVSAAAGLTQVQLGGNPAADYIVDTIGTGAAWLDFDADGDADLYLAQGAEGPSPGPPDQLLRNDGDRNGDGIPEFTDVAESAGLGDRRWTYGVSTADYDNDSDVDIYLANWGANRLYRNNGDGTFTDVGEPAGVADRGWGVSAAWSDVDRDGDVDLYVTNYVDFDYDRYPKRGEPGRQGEQPCRWRDAEVLCGPRTLEAGRDVLFRNDGDADGDGIPVFTDVTRQAGLELSESYYGLALLFFDSDNDGDEDLYVANDSVLNNYFVNRGDGTFDEMGLLSGLAYNEQGHEQAGMGVAVGDYNGDDRMDLAVTNFSHDHDTLYRNDGGHVFTDVSFPSGLGGVTYLSLGWGVVFGDLDHDGFEDLFVAHGHVYPQVDDKDMGTRFHQANGVYLHRPDNTFEEVTDRAGPGMEVVKCSRSALAADVDGDGDLDLVVTNLNDSPDLLLNDAPPGHWLQVRLQGRRSNRDGIGARVAIKVGGRRQVRRISRTASFAASTRAIAHFGLGPEETVERIEVSWPSGLSSLLENVAADQLVTITEDD